MDITITSVISIKIKSKELSTIIDILEEKNFDNQSVKYFEKKFKSFIDCLIDNQIQNETDISETNLALNIILMKLCKICCNSSFQNIDESLIYSHNGINYISNGLYADVYYDLLKNRYQSIKELLHSINTI